jgi:lipid-A-disaccharide synthase
MKLVKKYDTENKIKKIHFIAPSVWAHRKNRAQKISKIYDLLFCILPFEPPYFEKYSLKTVFVGHPIFDKDSTEYNFNLKENTYNKTSKIISITVGSRIGEVKRLLPIVINVINKLSSKYTFEYNILATEYTYNTIKEILKKQNINYINVIKDNEEKNNVIKKSLLAIAKSGTNTLELAGFSIPIVVMYKFNFLTNIIAKHIQKKADKKFATIINIINDKQIIPEYLLQNCNENNIFNEVVKLIDNEELRISQVQQNIKTLKILGYHNNNSSAIKIVNNIEELLNV